MYRKTIIIPPKKIKTTAKKYQIWTWKDKILPLITETKTRRKVIKIILLVFTIIGHISRSAISNIFIN